MKSNTEFTVLQTQAPERKGSTGLDTNYYRIKNRLTVALGYTYSSEKWNMRKLILWHSFGKEFTLILSPHSSNIQICPCQNTLEAPHSVIWWDVDVIYIVLACIRYVYDLQNSNEAVRGYVLPSTNPRFKPWRGFSYRPVSQCPLLVEISPDNSTSSEWGQVTYVNKLFLQTKRGLWHVNDSVASLRMNRWKIYSFVFTSARGVI